MAKEKLEIIVDAQGVAQTKREFKDLSRAEKQVVLQSKAANTQFNRMRVSTAGLRRSLGVIRNNLLLVTFAFSGLVIAIKKTIDSYRIQYEAEQRLIAGLANVEGATIGGARALINYASGLQTVTQFGDEAIISMMAMLSTFQLNETAIKELTPRVLDMATATGQDLTAAAIQAGKAFTGQIGALSRSGVVIDQTGLAIARAGGATSEFNFLLGQMDQNFKGLAETIGRGPLAELKKMENQLGDVSEEIGRESLPAVLFLKTAWRDLVIVGTHLGEIHKIMYSELVSYSEAIEIYLSKTGDVIATQLKINESLAQMKTAILTEQELATLRLTRDYLANDKVLSVQEQLNLLALRNIQLNKQYNIGLITKHQLEKGILQIQIQSLRVEGQRFSQLMGMIGPLSSLLSLAGLPGLAMMAGQAGTGISSVRQLLKFIPGFQTGADFVATQPRVIMVGERGPEHVKISPQAGPSQASVINNFYMQAPIPEDWIRNDLLPVLSRVQATG